MTTDFQEKARRLRNAVEPVAAGVYFAPEAHTAYEALGFDGSSLVSKDGIARPELKSYFTSRSACMGQVPGEVVAAAFGCFNPKAVVPAVTVGWQITSREAILDAREGNGRAATGDLLTAVDAGFNDKGRLRQQPEFQRLGGQIDLARVESRMR